MEAITIKPIKIAQIGIGHDHAPGIFDTLKQQSDIFDVVGYAVPDSERGRFENSMYAFSDSREMTVEEILSSRDIEAVTVETEEVNLTRYACLAAEAGKHIHMDKPGGLSPDEFQKVVEIQRRGGRVFHLGYMYRYNPFIVELLRRVRAGELGEIHSLEAQMNCLHPPEKRQWLGTFPGGMMFFLGCHLVDLALLFRGMPKNVLPLNRCTGSDEVTAEDYGFALLEYDNGFSIIKTDAFETGGFARRQLVIAGSRGTVELKPLERYDLEAKKLNPLGPSTFTGKTEYRGADWNDNGAYEKSENFGRYDAMMAGFAAYVRGEKQNPFTYDYELQVYDVLLRCCGIKK